MLTAVICSCPLHSKNGNKSFEHKSQGEIFPEPQKWRSEQKVNWIILWKAQQEPASCYASTKNSGPMYCKGEPLVYHRKKVYQSFIVFRAFSGRRINWSCYYKFTFQTIFSKILLYCSLLLLSEDAAYETFILHWETPWIIIIGSVKK